MIRLTAVDRRFILPLVLGRLPEPEPDPETDPAELDMFVQCAVRTIRVTVDVRTKIEERYRAPL